jgi:hypothetical protein
MRYIHYFIQTLDLLFCTPYVFVRVNVYFLNYMRLYVDHRMQNSQYCIKSIHPKVYNQICTLYVYIYKQILFIFVHIV